MTRRVQTFTADTGRDAGKQFLLTELPADQAEWWAIRVLRGAAAAGVELPADWDKAALGQVAALGFVALAALPESLLKPILDEMFTCVQYKAANPKIPAQDLIDGSGSQIEEVQTRIQLRKAVFCLHWDFSQAGATLTSG